MLEAIEQERMSASDVARSFVEHAIAVEQRREHGQVEDRCLADDEVRHDRRTGQSAGRLFWQNRAFAKEMRCNAKAPSCAPCSATRRSCTCPRSTTRWALAWSSRSATRPRTSADT